MNHAPTDIEQCALTFTIHLMERRYAEAYQMTAAEYQQAHSQATLQKDFEQLIPLDWELTAAIDWTQTMRDWGSKQADEVAWVYIAIPGRIYSEAIIVIIKMENENLTIKSIEYGRP